MKDPWLPVLAEPVVPESDVAPVSREALVLDLRRRWSRVKRAARNGANTLPGVNLAHEQGAETHGMADEDPSRAWRGSTPSLAGEEDDMGVLALSDEESEEGLGASRYVVRRFRRRNFSDLPPLSGIRPTSTRGSRLYRVRRINLLLGMRTSTEFALISLFDFNW
jgi:hypothetical protein